MLHRFIKNISLFCVILTVIGTIYLYSPWWIGTKHAQLGMTISDINCPQDYERLEYEDESMAYFLRKLPLKPFGVPIEPFEGSFTESDTVVHFNYCVLDIPLLSKYEQCADVCIHLRAMYLYQHRRFFDIHFEDTKHNVMRYYYGNCDHLFIKYLQHTIEWANTESFINEMPQRKLKDIQPGDVFVYDYKSRVGKKYGHAIMVADVAKNKKTGKKMIMLVQGSTPACSIHILKNIKNPEISPWFKLDEEAEDIDFVFAKYKDDELRFFK